MYKNNPFDLLDIQSSSYIPITLRSGIRTYIEAKAAANPCP
jgi:hypothetical protein